jgi:hypothetical protein
MRTRNKPRPATVFGIDIGKNPFHVVGFDAAGMPIQKATFRRDTLLQFFERAGPALVGMEACSGSQWLARKIAAMGHVNGARNLPTCGGPIFPTWAGMVISPRCDRGSRS